MFKQPNPRQDFYQLSEEMNKFWKEENIFKRSIDERPENNRYVFIDGPPFVTGTPHYGSLLSSITKDPVTRYWTMRGKQVRRVWGWDCHGLPIEEKVSKKFGLQTRQDIENFGVDKYVEACRAHVHEITNQWGWYIDAVGRWVDTDNAYYTMNPEFNESVIWVFKQMWDKGFIYKDKRVSLFSTDTATPVSEFEVAESNNYKDVDDLSIFVKFETNRELNPNINVLNDVEGRVNLVAWTTTPWTIPSNFALAVNPEADYVLVEQKSGDEDSVTSNEKFILAKERADYTFQSTETEKKYTILKEFKGSELEGIKYKPVYDFFVDQTTEKDYQVYLYEGVTTTDGSGILHVAPGFGEEDFNLGKKFGLSGHQDINDEGKFVVGPWEGMYLIKASKLIAEDLKEKGNLLRSEIYSHRVAFFRGDSPLIYKAQEAYFVDIQRIKDRMLELNQDINWIPDHIKEGRFADVIKSAPDWCISRTRYWATIMPLWRAADGEEIVVGSIEEMAQYNSDITKEIVDGKNVWMFQGKKLWLHRDVCDKIVLTKDGKEFKRVTDVMDGWLDSGSVPIAEYHYPFENKEVFENNYPADYIAEYVGQVRAWFNVLLRVSTILFDDIPFKNVICTGVMQGTDGRKMSKSFNNYPDPKATIERYGGDALRLYFIGSPLMTGGDMNFDEKDLKLQVQETLLPLWNIYTFLTTYANMHSWVPSVEHAYNKRVNENDSHPWDHIPFDNVTNELDIWILLRLQETIKSVNENMEAYNLPATVKVIKELIEDTSKWYIRESRDRFNDANQSAMGTLYYVLVETLKLLAPYAPFITEGIYKELVSKEMGSPDSIHLTDHPIHDQKFIDQYSQYKDEMAILRRITEMGHELRTANGLKVRQPLRKMEIATTNPKLAVVPDWMRLLLQKELNILEVLEARNIIDAPGVLVSTDTNHGITVGIDSNLDEELLEKGLLRELIRSIQAARKTNGFKQGETVTIELVTQNEKILVLAEKYSKDISDAVSASSLTSRNGEVNKETGVELGDALIEINIV
jgi:isoleucyl-tRNA synthetase